MAQSCCMSKTQRKSEDEPPMYDAVIIPGGGVDQQGVPHPWVVERLKRALTLDKQTKYYILLSRGTTHKAPPLDSEGVPIDEAAAGAKYLAEHGVSTDRILMERWSLDTIGNIYALRRLITEPMDMRSLVFVTNEFHMNRTRESVLWIYGMPPVWPFEAPVPPGLSSGMSFDFLSVANAGMSQEMVAARTAKEKASLKTLNQVTKEKVNSLAKLAQFLLVEHGAYNTPSAVKYRTQEGGQGEGDSEGAAASSGGGGGGGGGGGSALLSTY
ncbi:unnamed protein product [Vitrella brassicaformis CCMP3155]|uniref:DUF218 domain-containing protein n=2 Tax=Vitrella brassicaformis TaxID=1169539 RepID=A0A0G4EW97_VITBC|nr:unnamed protein product [Vitrella brassicaformis CCMP3155]|eukprot:CEM02523.1 unnamed protein product [Vitrella brassicaformis CCMP3155]